MEETRCKKCVTKNGFSNATLNDEGICNKCENYKEHKIELLGEEKLREVLDRIKGKHEYNCAVAFSGGKDSTYLLYLLKAKYNLKILAITGEDYISSPQEWENRFNVVKKLGVDHIIVRSDWSLFKEVYRAAITKSGMKPRAINLVHNLMHEKAIFEILNRYDIPFLITGNSQDELDMFKSWEEELGFKSTGDYSFDYWNNWREAYIDVLKEILPENLQEKIEDIVWKKPSPDGSASKTKHLSFFKYEPFDVEHNIKTIREKTGWKLPNDVGGTETDSAGLQFDVQVFRKLHGNEEYAFQISELIRNGTITREIALKALENNDNKIVENFFEEFQLSWDMLNPEQCTPILKKHLNLFLPIR